MADLVKFEVPAKLNDKQLALVEKVNKKGKIKIGINEVTKAIERGKAKLVLIAQDVSPQEIVMHLPLLCAEKNVPFSYVPTKKDLGEKAGIEVGTASLVIMDEGDAKKELKEVSDNLKKLNSKGE